MKKLLATVSMLALLGACSQTIDIDPQAETTHSKAYLEKKSTVTEETVSSIPDWFLDTPAKEDSVFSAGTATSQDLQLSVDLAVLAAKRVLADRIRGQMSSKLKEYTSRVGQAASGHIVSEVERVTANLIANAQASGYHVNETKVVPHGNLYRTYALLEFPINGTNEIALAQLVKVLNTESLGRAAAAHKELEKETNVPVATMPASPVPKVTTE